MEKVYDIGSRREVFWDDYLIDDRYTTAMRRMHHPVRKECVFQADKPWEGDASYFFNFFKDGDIYRMYYTARNTPEINPEPTPDSDRNLIRVCYAQSPDGIHWEKPALGICTFDGSTDNNIIWDIDHDDWHDPETQGDTLFVAKDPNPSCPPDEKYKAIYGVWKYNKEESYHDHTLKCLVSADGIHFRFGWYVYANRWYFDSLNTFYYDEVQGKYICYFRGWHASHELENNKEISFSKDRTRDIRRIESVDFRTWTEPEILEYGDDAPDFHLYINDIQRYPRAPHILVGFPARYPDRFEWTDNYDQLCGREDRLARMVVGKRFGLTVTDSLFMCSRDGLHFQRENEAFVRPEPENDWGWTYGDYYVAAGLMEKPSDLPGADPELSLLVVHKRWIPDGKGSRLYRHTIRMDGFIGRYAGYKPETLVTKPFLYKGDTLRINFETSAAGWMKVELLDKTGHPIEGYESCELFGNRIDRKVDFRLRLAAQEGKPVRLKFTMSDAEVYSFRFTKEEETEDPGQRLTLAQQMSVIAGDGRQ